MIDRNASRRSARFRHAGAADETNRLALAGALVALDVCRSASAVAAKDFEVSSRRAKIAALNLLEAVAKCQVPAFSAIAPSVAPGIAKALSVGYLGESGKSLTRVAVDCARATFIPPKPRERIQAVGMRGALVSLKKNCKNDRVSTIQSYEISNAKFVKWTWKSYRPKPRVDATWANVRALAKANVFRIWYKRWVKRTLAISKSKIANEQPATILLHPK